MILVDYNQVFLSAIFAQTREGNEIQEDLIRHTVLSCLLAYKRNFAKDFGDIVICADSNTGNYWRKDIYPYYKACRKKSRDASGLDWHLIFDSLGKIREELRDNLPYKVIIVDQAEADDIISTLTKYSQTHNLKINGVFDDEPEPVLILSSDRDFIQLHIYENVKQFSPVQRKFLKENSPDIYLKDKILHGDPGDGIPNVLSDSDTLVNPDKRQRPLRAKVLKNLMETDESLYEPEMKLNFERNKRLINLIEYIPEEIEQKIIECYESQKPSKKNMLKYFVKNNLRYLMEDLQNF